MGFGYFVVQETFDEQLNVRSYLGLPIVFQKAIIFLRPPSPLQFGKVAPLRVWKRPSECNPKP